MNHAAIVQFPHPGGEHNAKSKQPIFPWNTDRHHRKFLRSAGSYLDDQGGVVDAQLRFWGEWEAPSRVVQSWPKVASLPTYLHEPFWETPGFSGFRQNTDPWVFGDYFRYSNCKQLGQKALLNLAPGSLVLFGSSLDGDFVLDTCFVAASSVAMLKAKGDDEAFDVCTIGSLRHDTDYFRVHRGASAAHTTNGIFSFTPCLPDGGAERFSRPVIVLPPYVNRHSKQSTRGAAVMLPLTEVKEAWESVVNQVRNQGLELGVHLDTPPLIERSILPGKTQRPRPGDTYHDDLSTARTFSAETAQHLR